MNNNEISPGNKEESKVPVCENHGSKQFIFLCRVCNTGLCKFCITNLKDGPHANHALEDYSTAFEELRKNINKTESQIEKLTMDLASVLSIMKEEVDEASKKEIESIIKREQEIIAKAKEWRKHTIENIESEKQARHSDITAKYFLLKEKLDGMIGDLNTAKPLLDSNDCNAFIVYKDIDEHKTLSIINEEIVKFSKNTNQKNVVSLPTVERFGMLAPNMKHTSYDTGINEFSNLKQYECSPTSSEIPWGRTSVAGPSASGPISNAVTPPSAPLAGQCSAPPAKNEPSQSLLDTLKSANQYNPKDFNLNPKGARYFVIKAYTDDAIHHSIKYSTWCSTEHGNKRLDSAYREREGKGPVYLLYSVNGSGHFCGIAQMMSAVDHGSSSSAWALGKHKLKGQFQVTWIYVKDVPNSQLRHIRLENNENKPVTNSRDTQEVPPEKGKQVCKIIHHYRHTTTIFDDVAHTE